MAKICQTRGACNNPRSSSFSSYNLAPSLPARFRFRLAALLLFSFICLTDSVCHAQSHDVICHEGAGEFEAGPNAGIRVHVGAARNGELAARVCAASLNWGNESLVISSAASDLDIDVFAVDLGLGPLVVTAQVKKSKVECCMVYNIYSLRTPPELLRSISGGQFFSAADTDLDGRVEIWTDDAASVEGFENLHLNDLDSPPPLVLRFARGRLLDVSSEFRPVFDRKIAELRAKLDPRVLADFKSSDGRLKPAADLAADRMLRLRNVKIKILEIVWSYLYSGREKEAWRSLAEMWPAADLDRIRAAIANAHAHGIRSQVDGVSTAVSPGRDRRAKIFDGTTTISATPGVTPKDVKPKPEIIPPRAMLMERPPPVTAVEIELSQTESLLKLVIDSAGKVRSVEQMNGSQTVDEGLLRSTVNWKFVPAFSEGQPVASRIFLGVSLRR
jgi:hypothetical protein